MKCPMCNVAMREVDRRGIRIDVCPECRGVWLDGGELEKLLSAGDQWESEYRHREYQPDREYPQQPKKRKGFLGELFDVFD